MQEDASVNVTISGVVNSGKSIIGAIILKALTDKGVTVSFTDGDGWPDGYCREEIKSKLELISGDGEYPKPAVVLSEQIIAKPVVTKAKPVPTGKEVLVLNIYTPNMNNTNTEKVTIKLRPDLAPKHVERIIELTREGFYDGIMFHRVIKGFMAQGGNPTGIGMHGSNKPDLNAEFNAEPHVRGVCSMARAQNPNSANSQFFICFDDARFLDKQYTVWGEVIEGMEVIDGLPVGEPPCNPGVIKSATIEDDTQVEE